MDGVYNWNENDAGLTIIHEGAHFMGLVHTTEEEGETFDLFTDTPECRASEFDSNGDGLVEDFECDGVADGDNFMFWLEGGPEISAGQAWAMRRHPFFYVVGQ